MQRPKAYLFGMTMILLLSAVGKGTNAAQVGDIAEYLRKFHDIEVKRLSSATQSPSLQSVLMEFPEVQFLMQTHDETGVGIVIAFDENIGQIVTTKEIPDAEARSLRSEKVRGQLDFLDRPSPLAGTLDQLVSEGRFQKSDPAIAWDPSLASKNFTLRLENRPIQEVTPQDLNKPKSPSETNLVKQAERLARLTDPQGLTLSSQNQKGLYADQAPEQAESSTGPARRFRGDGAASELR